MFWKREKASNCHLDESAGGIRMDTKDLRSFMRVYEEKSVNKAEIGRASCRERV